MIFCFFANIRLIFYNPQMIYPFQFIYGFFRFEYDYWNIWAFISSHLLWLLTMQGPRFQPTASHSEAVRCNDDLTRTTIELISVLKAHFAQIGAEFKIFLNLSEKAKFRVYKNYSFLCSYHISLMSVFNFSIFWRTRLHYSKE